ncbi:DUF2690 domain-containing protein [Streptomyces sp. NPDC047072]|uniref:helix-turn-helix domain-containing protein n=1 Tax=Streptomyces sp. NPDC047072 TaxID=3154809 RepID=UPI0033FB6023
MPDELDPQIKEFASQLRRLVDRSGLSVAAVADRTGYSKTSWERYLGGRLLAPKGAIVALAEVTGTNPIHLTTMWELAERAWSRSEMRHDMTMEAIRISQARAALGEFGVPPANVKSGKSGKAARKGGSATVTPGVAGPAGVAPTVPPQPTSTEEREAAGTPSGGGSSGGGPVDGTAVSGAPANGAQSANSWGLAGYQGPSPSGGRSGGTVVPRQGGAGVEAGVGAGAGPANGAVADGPGWTPGAPNPYGEPPRDARPGDGSGGGGGKRRLTMFLAGVIGVLVVVAAAFFLTDGGDGKKKDASASASPSASTSVDLPAGVKCSGAACTGKDAEAMGCSGDLVTTAKTATVGTAVVEVRYSETCGAAWGRVTQGGQGDAVKVTAGKVSEDGSITDAGDTIAYTPMVAVKDAGEAKACVTLGSGQAGCTD